MLPHWKCDYWRKFTSTSNTKYMWDRFQKYWETRTPAQNKHWICQIFFLLVFSHIWMILNANFDMTIKSRDANIINLECGTVSGIHSRWIGMLLTFVILVKCLEWGKVHWQWDKTNQNKKWENPDCIQSSLHYKQITPQSDSPIIQYSRNIRK